MSCDVCMGINSSRCPVCGNEEADSEVDCPMCHGTGAINCWAISLETGLQVKINASAWLTLPWTKEDAVAMRAKYMQGDGETCPLCGGYGVVSDKVASDWRNSR